MKYTSNAEWTKIGKSTDTHQTREAAEGVCEMLLLNYGVNTIGCEIRGKCKRTWVEELQESMK